MLVPTEQITKLSNAHLETSLALAALSVDSAGRLFARHMHFAKDALAEHADTLIAGLHGETKAQPADFSQVYERQLKKVLDLSQDYFEITVTTQSEMARMIRDNVEALTQAGLQGAQTAVAAASSGQEESEEGNGSAAKPKGKS